MYCSWLVFRPGLLGLETSGGGGFTGPGTAGIPVGAAAVVDILWQLSHLLSQQQLKEALLVEAWHPISGPNQALGLGGRSSGEMLAAAGSAGKTDFIFPEAVFKTSQRV